MPSSPRRRRAFRHPSKSLPSTSPSSTTRQAGDESRPGGLQRSRRWESTSRRYGGVGAAGHAESSAPAAPPPPEGYTSNENSTGGRLIVIAVDRAEHPLRRRDGDRPGGQRVHRPVVAVRSHRRGQLRHGGPATVFTADRARVKRVIARMAGQKHAGRTVDMGHNIGLTEAISIYNRRSHHARTGPEPRMQPQSVGTEYDPGRDVQDRGRDGGACARAGDDPRRRQTIQRTAPSLIGPARDRRAEDADPHLGRFRHRRHGWCSTSGGWRPRRARACTRCGSTIRCSTSPMDVRRSTRLATGRRARKGSRRSPARRAARCSPSSGAEAPIFDAHRVGALRLLPARRRVRSEGSRWKAASHPGRCPATRGDRAIAAADPERPGRSARAALARGRWRRRP